MTKRIKNNDMIPHTWCGQEIQPGEYYTIQAIEDSRWANDSSLLIDIANAIAIVNDGTSDITDANIAIDYMKDNLPVESIIISQPNPAPFAEPSFRTKRSATANLVTIAPGSSGTIDYYITQERYVAGGTILVSGAQFGDYATAEVRDIDGVIPSPYRAALCENWPTVAKYIEKEWIEAHDSNIAMHKIDTYPLNAKITAGLYLRVTYYTTNAGPNRTIGVNYFLTKKL